MLVLKIYVKIFLILQVAFSFSQQSEEGKKEVNGISIYYKIIGEGKPIIFIHGGPGLDHSYFLPQMENLSSDFKLIFYDQRASGRSQIDVDTASLTPENFVEDLEGLRKALGLEKINLFAHSWGGLIAIRYAAKYPQNLESFILSNSVPASKEFDSVVWLRQKQFVTSEDRMEKKQIVESSEFKSKNVEAYEKFFRISFRSCFYNRSYADSLTLKFNPNYAQCIGMLKYYSLNFLSYNLNSELNKITVPALIIRGEYDATPFESDKEIKDSIKGSQLVEIKQCGHFPFIEKKEEFFKTITDFIQK